MEEEDGDEEWDEEGFRHPMLELAAIYGRENEFVRRWLEEEEKTRKRGTKGSLSG